MPYADPIKRKEYMKKYNQNRKEKMKKYLKKYREDNKDQITAGKKKYYMKNKQKIIESSAENSQKPARYDTYYEKFLPYYGSENLQRDPKNSELIQFRCKYCNNWFNPTNQQLITRYKAICGRQSGDCELYCSEGCKRACPTYGQILYQKDFKQNTSREVQPELRKMVLERDDWTCQKCGKSKDEFPELELHCHHKYPLNEDPIQSADMDTCITLCKECHQWIHMNVPGCGYSELKC